MAARLWPQSLLKDRRTAWILTLLGLALFAAGNLPWRLDDYDQAKQALTSYQMVNDGRWFYQTTSHDRIATKPPLVGWVSAGLFAVTRSWDLAWRLPSFLAAAALALLLFRWSRSANGEVPALITLAAFTLNLVSPRLATLVRTDMPLALVIFVIGALIWNKIRHQQQWQPNDRLFIFLLLTAGMLIKGPVVWAFLLPGIVVYQLCRDKGAVPGFPGFWPWIASLIVFLVWVAIGVRFIPEFYDQVVVREFLGRFGGETHRAQPLFFYIPHLLHKFAPWSLLMIALALLELRRAEWKWKSVRLSPQTRWLVCWSLGGLVVLSLLPSKRVDRIFPVIPPLCLLLGAQIGAFVSAAPKPLHVYRWTGAALASAIVFTGTYVIWKVTSGYNEHRDALVQFGTEVRRQVTTHDQRYAVVSSPDEALLLYLRRSDFVLPQRAAQQWNDGQLDALVVWAGDATALMAQLKPAGIAAYRSPHVEGGDSGQYLLLTKTKQ